MPKKKHPHKQAMSVEQRNIEAFRIAAIDKVHSLNIGGRNALDGTAHPKPREPTMKTYQCSVRRCSHNLEGFCTVLSCLHYVLYRVETGKCEACGAEMASHPKCDACGILCGTGHLYGVPSLYRGHNLCGYCVTSWKRLDRLIGGETTYEEFKSPPLRMWKTKEDGDKDHG